jgi:DNA-binding NarL/FixJ family response regulator
MTRVFLVDDHAIIRLGYVALIKGEPDMEVCGEAGNAIEALGLIRGVKPDIVVADIGLEGMNGIEMVKHLKAELPDLPVLVISMHDESLYAERALAAGARGYLMKSIADTMMITAIRQIVNGGFHLSEKINQRILTRFTTGRPAVASSPLELLSDREIEIFELIGRGLSTGQIASTIMISPKTVETYRGRIKEKIGVDSTSELVQQAVFWVQSKVSS